MNIELINFLDTSTEVQLETRNWRNSDNVVPYFKIKYIDDDTHKKWLSTLQNEPPKNIAFIIKFNGEYVGVTYFHSVDYSQRKADWGIYIHKVDSQDRGIGRYALSECIKYAKENLCIKEIYLDVLSTNERAKKLYEKIGFKRIGKKNNFYRYEYCLE